MRASRIHFISTITATVVFTFTGLLALPALARPQAATRNQGQANADRAQSVERLLSLAKSQIRDLVS